MKETTKFLSPKTLNLLEQGQQTQNPKFLCKKIMQFLCGIVTKKLRELFCELQER
jgi:hypothetical protein